MEEDIHIDVGDKIRGVFVLFSLICSIIIIPKIFFLFIGISISFFLLFKILDSLFN